MNFFSFLFRAPQESFEFYLPSSSGGFFFFFFFFFGIRDFPIIFYHDFYILYYICFWLVASWDEKKGGQNNQNLLIKSISRETYKKGFM